MNVAIELHDSSVTALTVEPTLVHLTLSAYVHKSSGRPGLDAGTVWLQEAVLKVERGVMQGKIEHLPWDLADGWCRVDQRRFENILPVPLAGDDAEVHLVELFSQQAVTITGAKVKLELVGEPEFVEDFHRSPWAE